MGACPRRTARTAGLPRREASPTPASTATGAGQTPASAIADGSALTLVQRFDGQEAYEIVRFFTSKELAGRKAGAPGADMAADYAANKLKAAGLKPVGDNGTYFQDLTLPFIDLAEEPYLRLLDADGSVKRAFKMRQDFSEIISGRANQGHADGKLVFLVRGTDEEAHGTIRRPGLALAAEARSRRGGDFDRFPRGTRPKAGSGVPLGK